MKKKLLIMISNMEIGGAQKMVYELVRALDYSRYDPIILCNGKRQGNALEYDVEKLCTVVYCNIEGHFGIKNLLKVFGEIKKIAPDVIHAHLGGVALALPWCLLHRGKIVVTAHTQPEKAFSPKIEKILRIALKRGKATLVAVSKKNYEACKKYFSLDDDRCTYVNNGINLARFYRQAHQNFTYINLARQDENKNQALLLRCFQRIHEEYNDTSLILAGDGPTHNALQDLARKLGLEQSVAFPGMVDTPEDYYAVSDAYVQSSHREAMPLSILEAMAAGLPILSTDVGGIHDVINENGFLLPDHDEELYYRTMRQLYVLSAEEREEMSRASKAIVEEYSAEKMAERYMEIYDSTVR